MKICQFVFYMINSMPKILNNLKPFFYFFPFHVSCKTFMYHEIHDSPARKRGLSCHHAMHHFQHHHADYAVVSRITPWKKDRSCHHAMHHFHGITPIFLLFHEWCPAKMSNHAITPTAEGASIKLLAVFASIYLS